MKNHLIITVLVFVSSFLNAQTFNGTGGIIPDNGNAAYFSIEVGSLGTAILDTNFGVLNACINITHTYDSDLEVALISPNGTQIMLTYGNGGDGDNFTNTCFDDRAAVSITQGIAPFTGSFRPNEMLGSVNNGQAGNGTWTLYIHDMYPWSDNGTLLNWSITFGPDATGPFVLTSSNLPIVTLDTYGAVIPDDPKIPAGLKIFNNGPGIRNYITDTPELDGHSGVEIRGSSSQMFPKKSYGLETWDALGNSVDTSLLGMPSENDWILNANYTDKSLMRNTLAYQVFQNMGLYATRYQFVELVLNGQYKGVYIFSEKIKRNKNRVNIAKLKPEQNTGDDVTGGYIIKVDKFTGSGGSGWTSSYPPPAHVNDQTIFFQYEYPKEEDITIQQKSYIQNYVYTFETALKSQNFADTINGYRKYAVESTFIDYFLVNEISKNVDGYRLSTFLHKQRDSEGGKIRMGPVWDYDIAWHNANYCDGDITSGWAYEFPCPDDYWQVPFWWSRLLMDPLYTSHLKCRWQFLRQNMLSNAWFDNYLDSISGRLNEAQQRNFLTWPILGIYVWPNPWPYAPTYEGEVSGLKTWLHNRLAWLDANMPGTCNTTSTINLTDADHFIHVYPNPVDDVLKIEYAIENRTQVSTSIINLQGITTMISPIQMKPAGRCAETIDVSSYPPGVYVVRLDIDGKSYHQRFIKL